ncbi:MAG: hypothetical protein RBU37_23115 [Myxococcota bacterium]|jgi:hypothetical protein|nr:hypothetical protein [Myxococcota bacterium]
MSNGQRYLAAINARAAKLSKELSALRQERELHLAEAERFDQERQRISLEFAAYLLPEVSDKALAKLQQRIHYPGLLPIKKEVDERLEAADQERASLAKLPEVEHFDFHQSQVKDELAALEDSYQSYARKKAAWLASADYHALDKRQYFDPRYAPRFFKRLADWRNVSLLMEQLERAEPGRARFANPQAIRDEHALVFGEGSAIIEAYQDQQKRLGELEAQYARYQELLAAPKRLLTELYERLSEALVKHVESYTDTLLLELGSGDKHVVAFLQKMVGMRKQADYLREIVTRRLYPQISQLEREHNKIESKAQRVNRKLWRGKAIYVSGADQIAMERFDHQKWEKRRQRYAQTRSRLSSFDSYHRGSPARDYLWWDLMTKGSRGDDLPEVNRFRAAHPGWDYRSYQEPWSTVSNVVITAAAVDLAADALSLQQSDSSFDHHKRDIS